MKQKLDAVAAQVHVRVGEYPAWYENVVIVLVVPT